MSALDPSVEAGQVQWQLSDDAPSAPMPVGEHVTLVRGDGFARLVTLTTISPVGVAETTAAITVPN